MKYLTNNSITNYIVNNATIKIKRRGEDGYKQISVRIKEDIWEALDKLASETNYSKDEIINLLLRHGVDHAEIEQ